MSATVGIIAGQGTLPFLVARGMRAQGRRVHCVGLRGQWEDGLPACCDAFQEAGVLQLGRWIRLFRRAGVTEVTMVGRVSKKQMHDPWLMLKALRDLPDWRTADLWFRRLRHDRRSATLLRVVADDLATEGVILIDSTRYIPDHMATEGTMGSVAPDARAQADIAFGWPLLEKVGGLDIGQAISVRERDVIAVEAVEGTDSMIRRTGELCRARGWTLLKSARPGHDMRADVPTIGVQTIEGLAKAGAGCVALGVGRVILVDRPAVLAAADRAGIAVVGVKA
ncbi:MAG: LpxI family protein [Phycisphaerales bacterium]|nr:LpxI family protein [Phycisphaerales bacterium]